MRTLVASLVCGLLLVGVEAWSDPPTIPPGVSTAFKSMSVALGEAKEFSLECETLVDEVVPPGLRIQLSHTIDLVVRRPAHFAYRISGDRMNRSVWYDGKTLTMLDPKDNVYGTLEFAGTLDQLLEHVSEKYDTTMPLVDLMYSDVHATMIGDRVLAAASLGKHFVGRTSCLHLAFAQADINWQVWIEDGQRPLPRKLVITYKREPHEPQWTGIIKEWILTPKIDADTFVARIPEGAEKIEFKPAGVLHGRAGGSKPEGK